MMYMLIIFEKKLVCGLQNTCASYTVVEPVHVWCIFKLLCNTDSSKTGEQLV